MSQWKQIIKQFPAIISLGCDFLNRLLVELIDDILHLIVRDRIIVEFLLDYLQMAIWVGRWHVYDRFKNFRLFRQLEYISRSMHIDVNGKLQSFVELYGRCGMKNDSNVRHEHLSIGEWQAKSSHRAITCNGYDFVTKFGHCFAEFLKQLWIE